MTHFVGLVFAESENELERRVRHYDENRSVTPYFEELDLESLKRMAKNYKIKLDDKKAILEHMRDWTGCPPAEKDGKIGYMSTYNPDSKWDWYVVGGRWSGEVPENMCQAKDVKKYFEELPSVIVDEHGWHADSNFGWWGYSEPIADQKDVVKQKLDERPNDTIYVVDFHI